MSTIIAGDFFGEIDFGVARAVLLHFLKKHGNLTTSVGSRNPGKNSSHPKHMNAIAPQFGRAFSLNDRRAIGGIQRVATSVNRTLSRLFAIRAEDISIDCRGATVENASTTPHPRLKIEFSAVGALRRTTVILLPMPYASQKNRAIAPFPSGWTAKEIRFMAPNLQFKRRGLW